MQRKTPAYYNRVIGLALGVIALLVLAIFYGVDQLFHQLGRHVDLQTIEMKGALVTLHNRSALFFVVSVVVLGVLSSFVFFPLFRQFAAVVREVEIESAAR